MCDCIEQTLQKAKEVIKKDLPDGVVDDTLVFNVQGSVFRFDGSKNTIPAMTVNAEYKLIKTDGTPRKNTSKKTLPIFGSHCPFCGEKHEQK